MKIFFSHILFIYETSTHIVFIFKVESTTSTHRSNNEKNFYRIFRIFYDRISIKNVFIKESNFRLLYLHSNTLEKNTLIYVVCTSVYTHVGTGKFIYTTDQLTRFSRKSSLCTLYTGRNSIAHREQKEQLFIHYKLYKILKTCLQNYKYFLF